MKQPMLIDTDTASDDAVALIMALRDAATRVLAITTVAGNVGVEQATVNALYTAGLCGSAVPVYQGAARPLFRRHEPADWFHGGDGLGDHRYASPSRGPERENAVNAILELSQEHPGLTIVTLGPLTNIAIALLQDPTLPQRVGRLVLMGGNPGCEGNVTPAAEYNIWCDPEAARWVFRSGLAIDLVGWHLCRREAALSPAEIDALWGSGSALARFAVECNSHARLAYRTQTGEDGIALPDPVCMAIALDRTIGREWSRHRVEVETVSELGRGQTLIDRLNVGGDERNRRVWAEAGSAEICWTLDVGRWKELLGVALR